MVGSRCDDGYVSAVNRTIALRKTPPCLKSFNHSIELTSDWHAHVFWCQLFTNDTATVSHNRAHGRHADAEEMTDCAIFEVSCESPYRYGNTMLIVLLNVVSLRHMNGSNSPHISINVVFSTSADLTRTWHLPRLQCRSCHPHS